MKKSNYNYVQKQINKMGYENYQKKQLEKMESDTTQILSNNIKTSDIGLVTLMLMNGHKTTKVFNEQGYWLIEKNKNTEDLYRKYKDKEVFVDSLVYSKTLINLITKAI